MRKGLLVTGLIALIVGVLSATVPLLAVQVGKTREVPYEVQVEKTRAVTKTAQWQVSWRTLTGEMKWGAEVGTSTFPATFDYDWKGGEMFGGYESYIGFDATMEVYVDRDGPISFKIGSDDGSRLYVDGDLAIDNWGSHSYIVKSTILTLSKGKHSLEMRYYNVPGLLWDASRASFECDRDILMWQETETYYETETRYRTETYYETEMRPLLPSELLPYVAIIGLSITIVGAIMKPKTVKEIPKQKVEPTIPEKTFDKKEKLQLERERLAEMLSSFKQKYEGGELDKESYEKLKLKYQRKIDDLDQELAKRQGDS